MSTRELIIGIDLANDYSQLSYALDLSEEPESISFKDQEYEYFIPTVVGLQTNKKQWVYGQEAIKMAKENKAQIVTHLLDKVNEDHKIDIYGSLYDPIYIMERFIYKLLMKLKNKWPDKTVRQMVITVNETRPKIIDGLYKALGNLGIHKDRIQIQSHSQSYLSFVLSQEKSLWINDVALFDFNGEGFTYSQVSIDRRRTPYLAEIRYKDYNESITYNESYKLKEDGNFDYVLENIINDALYKQLVSTVYFTGIGFIDGIPMTTIKKISKGRRIFIGQNLYCKGACYAALQLAGRDTLDNVVFLLEDTAHYSVEVAIYEDGTNKDISLCELGTAIYEGPKSLDLILDDVNQIPYKVKDKRGQIVSQGRLVLDGLPRRPNKTTRVELLLRFISNSRFKLQIADKGFGEMYPATDKVWEEEVIING